VAVLRRLSPGEIRTYLKGQHLDVEAFLHAARLAGAERMLDTPFYLVRIAAL